jgi:acyl-CoA thioesterase I
MKVSRQPGSEALGSYGKPGGPVQTRRFALLAIGALMMSPAAAAERPVRIVMLGDSIAAGLGLPVGDALPAKLEKALKAKGLNVTVENAGVSGDTPAGGLARLDWSVAEGTDAVIVELGANDALRGADPKQTRAALDAIIRKLKERKIAVLLTGMLAPRNFGPDYVAAFDKIYPELAAAHGVLLYPFLLDGIAGEAALNQPDGIHPNAAGVDALVKGLTPKAEELVLRVKLGMR